jgi:hypothetical protein
MVFLSPLENLDQIMTASTHIPLNLSSTIRRNIVRYNPVVCYTVIIIK